MAIKSTLTNDKGEVLYPVTRAECVMVDEKRSIKDVEDKALIELFNVAAGDYGGYDYENAPDKEKPYKLNELYLSKDEMLDVLIHGRTEYPFPACINSTCRTNLLLSEINQRFNGNYSSVSLKTICSRALKIEVLRLAPTETDEVAVASDGTSYMLYNANRLRKIIGIIDLKNVTTGNLLTQFQGTSVLADIKLKSLKLNIKLPSSYMTYESLQYMVANAANTSAITAQIHSSIYKAMTGEAESYPVNGGTQEQWVQLFEDAAAKQIAFATS